MKGYCATLNHVFSLAGVIMAANCIVSRMFCSFEKSCPPCEVKPPEWNLSLVLWSLTRPPCEPVKGPVIIFGDSFCRTVWGVCLSWICIDYFFSLFFPLATKLIGPQTGCQFFKNVDFFDTGPLKLSSDKHFTWKTCVLLALVLARRVSELLGISYCIRHLRGGRSCTISYLLDLVAKTQNPSVHDP